MKSLIFTISTMCILLLVSSCNNEISSDCKRFGLNTTVKSVQVKTSPAYELYRTDNMWTFMKLETSTGKIWQVQYAVGDGDAFQVVLNDISLAFDGMETAGRFKLHPTDNIYNFILLDTQTGNVWQAQWSQNPDNRGVMPIYEL